LLCFLAACSDAYGIKLALNNLSKKDIKEANENISEAGRVIKRVFWKKNKVTEYFLPKTLKDSKKLLAGVALFAAYKCISETKDGLSWFRDLWLLETTLRRIMLQQAKYLEGSKQLYELIKKHPVLSQSKDLRAITNFFETEQTNSKELKELLKLMTVERIEEGLSYDGHIGFVLRAYSLIIKNKQKIAKMILAIGKLDAYLSCAKLYKEFENKRVKFCFAKFESADKPFIKSKEFWHPLLGEKKAIPNSISLGQNNRANIIITGPNAGGKSCILKALTLSLFLAQTIGMAPATELQFTPFYSIETYLNITDNINKGSSLFKAEVLRAHNLIKKIEKSHNNPSGDKQFYFSIFDEMFNGTSPLEGAAAAYGCANYLGTFPNSIALIATHFPVMVDLEKNTKTFSNYKITVNKDESGKINYLYTLLPGISYQNVAIDILKNEGFSGEIIDKAQELITSHWISGTIPSTLVTNSF